MPHVSKKYCFVGLLYFASYNSNASVANGDDLIVDFFAPPKNAYYVLFYVCSDTDRKDI